MSTNPDLAMQELYRDALKETTIRQLTKDRDWTVFRAISETAAKHEQIEKEGYQRNYSARVDKVRQELIRKAGSKTHEHPTPYGTDRFNKGQIDRDAQRIIRHEHARKLATILSVETNGYEALCERIRERDKVMDRARNDFTRAVDRRNGHVRRDTGPSR